MTRAVSRRWLQSVPGTNRWVSEISWSNDGFRTWDYADLIEGSATADANDQVRWKTELSILAPFGRSGINPFSTQIRVRHGLAWSFAETDRELLGMGHYKVMSCNRSRSEPGRVNLSGNSFEQYLIEARLRRPRQLGAAYADARLQDLVTDILPTAVIDWSPEVSRRWLPKTMVERDRWEAIDGGQSAGSIAKALGARIFTNGAGVWIVAPTPALTDAPTWEADIGPGGMLINSTDEYTNEYVYNAVVVSGESTDEEADTIAPITVMDNDPESLTYFWRPVNEGGFGEKPKYYTSQLITSEAQARSAGQGLLAPSLGLRQTVTFDSLHDPRKEPGDVGLVTGPDGHQERVILDSVTYDLLGGPLQAQTRSTQTRLAGTQEAVSGDSGDTEGLEEMAAP